MSGMKGMAWPRKPATGPAPAPAASETVTVAPEPKQPEAPRMDVKTELKVELHQNLLGRINLAALESMTRDQVSKDIGDILGIKGFAQRLTARGYPVARDRTAGSLRIGLKLQTVPAHGSGSLCP